MNRAFTRGSVLVVGLMLLALISTLALSAASAAHVELQLARNEQFRENAASAASAGIESAISRIVTAATPEAIPAELRASLPAISGSFEVHSRVLGYETGLAQAPGESLVGAHFEIISTGSAARGAYDRQRAIIVRIMTVAPPADGTACEPVVAGIPCVTSGQWRRLSWQRLPRE